MTHLSSELRLGWVRSGLVLHNGVKGGLWEGAQHGTISQLSGYVGLYVLRMIDG